MRKKDQQSEIVFCKEKQRKLVGRIEERLTRRVEYFQEVYETEEEEETIY